MRSRGARVLFALATALATLYIADLAVLKFRKDSTGVVKVHPYTAIPRNDKREELIFDDPHDEACVNTLFPHAQMSPCWYLRRHPQRRLNL
jgi:hypothetical protein